ncbi:restriction endonuclease subunit S [Helicobacter pylori]|uniref:restriction endonuclease subunit S n=1 Tax=Helicobacter pylori TaxID=210 RepID=UPI001E2E0CAD|nr:restriction endonuclease subunit S [Helicobacter pylori]UFG20133.1 restriction endonuclease subunit S [Helicobacter pylori]
MDALMLPLNWQRVRLGDILELLTDYHANGSYELLKNNVTLLKHVDFAIMIRTTNFENNDFKNDLIYINKKAYEFLSKSKVFAGDILVNKIANAGTAYFMPKLNQPVSLGMNLFLLRIKPNYNNFFIFKQIANYERVLKTFANGSATKTITKNVIKNLLIPLPPLNEQIAIANILSALDRYLYALDALILKKEGVKKALSFELLSQRKRLKGFNQAWQRVRLGDIGITISGLVGKTKQDFINGNAKYITFLNVLNNVIIDTSILENVKIYPNEKQNSFKKYDLFFNTSSETPKEVGMCAVLLDDIDQVFLNSFCFGFRIFDKAVDGLFLSYLINSEIGRKAFENLAQGSTRYNLSKSGFNNVCLSLPPLNEQIAIANILSALDNEITSLKNKKRQFENIKKALNHDLMSAKIRVLKK